MSPSGGDLQEVIDLLAHDLRNPLSAMLTGAEVLKRRADVPETAHKTLDRVRASGERMSRMIDQMVDWASCLGDARLDVDRADGDLHALCRELLQDLPEAQTSRIALELDGDGRGRWDGERVTQLLRTLLDNAIDHGHPEAPVRLCFSSDENTVRVEVRNQGAAIAPELLPLLFDPVARRGVQRPSRARGLGFGLWLGRAIAAAHGGTLDISSSADATTARVALAR